MQDNIIGAASDGLISVVDAVMDGNKGLKNLEHVYLYGIAASSEPLYPSSRLMQASQARGAKFEARVGRWCQFDDDNGMLYWAAWAGDEESEGEDDEDDESMKAKDRWDTVKVSVGGDTEMDDY